MFALHLKNARSPISTARSLPTAHQRAYDVLSLDEKLPYRFILMQG